MTDKPCITCKELYEFLADYLDGALVPDQRREFDRHLGVCPSCVAYLDGDQRTIAMRKEAFGPADAPAP
ncbi:MAG: zf-HC2 domain-containing protein, partial [Planctomycetota bacterium]